MTPDNLEPEALRRALGQACALMKVLANADRLRIVCLLSQGERWVGALQEELGIVQPTLSQQLTVLREEGLVSTRREGKNIYYQLSSPQALAVVQVLYAQFCAPSADTNASTDTNTGTEIATQRTHA